MCTARNFEKFFPVLTPLRPRLFRRLRRKLNACGVYDVVLLAVAQDGAHRRHQLAVSFELSGEREHTSVRPGWPREDCPVGGRRYHQQQQQPQWESSTSSATASVAATPPTGIFFLGAQTIRRAREYATRSVEVGSIGYDGTVNNSQNTYGEPWH